MSDTDGTPTHTEQIRADIEQTRTDLAETVDQVVDKLNPKTQLADKAHKIDDATAPHRGKIVVGAIAGVAAVVAFVVVRRARSGGK